jgi:hypothetical protein
MSCYQNQQPHVQEIHEKIKIKERGASIALCASLNEGGISLSLTQLSFLFPFGEEFFSKSRHMLLAFPRSLARHKQHPVQALAKDLFVYTAC